MSFPRFELQKTEAPPATTATVATLDVSGIVPERRATTVGTGFVAHVASVAGGTPKTAFFEQSEIQLASWRASILAAPAAAAPGFDKLAAVSLRFLDSEWPLKALASLWDAVSLFAVHEGPAPRERLDAWGLVPLLAWGVHRYSIISFDANACLLRTSGGADLRQWRLRANFDQVVCWWTHPTIEGDQHARA